MRAGVSFLLNLLKLITLFLPFIVSFKTITIDSYNYNTDLFVLFINMLSFTLMNIFFTILIPRNPRSSVYYSYIFSILFLCGQIVNIIIPLPAVEFNGVVNGVLSFRTFTMFFFTNLHVLLYMFVISIFLEHEVIET